MFGFRVRADGKLKNFLKKIFLLQKLLGYKIRKNSARISIKQGWAKSKNKKRNAKLFALKNTRIRTMRNAKVRNKPSPGIKASIRGE